jgi:hypothetical protein
MHISNAPVLAFDVSAAGVAISNVTAYGQDGYESIPCRCMEVPLRHHCAQIASDVRRPLNQRLPWGVCSG